MEYHSSLFPAGPEWNTFFMQLRQRAHRQLLNRFAPYQHRDALENAITDGLLIFWRKMTAADLEVQHPQAFAFEIVKRTFWDYRRRSRSAQLPPEEQRKVVQQLAPRPRYADGDQLFGQLHEPHLWRWYQELSKRDQSLIDLRCQGFLDREIAQQLHFSHGWVRNRFSYLLNSARAIAQRA